VHVDKPGGDDESVRVDSSVGPPAQLSDRVDATVVDGDVSVAAGVPVPSTTVPLRMIRSIASPKRTAGLCEFVEEGFRTSCCCPSSHLSFS
jgi:hypothetical protein